MSGARPGGHAGWFIAVGCTAAAVHWATVVGLVRGTGLAPLLANPLGWLVAFGVSWAGHQRLSFAAMRAPWQQTLPRFFALSAAGFAVNEAAYAVLLRLGGWRFDLALGAVLVGVAFATWLLSRHWAFRGTAAPAPHDRA